VPARRRDALDPVVSASVLARVLGPRASMVGAVLLAAERTHLMDWPGDGR
jgi:hypothetical protein